jgi:uncharacterized SAM-binding protein YcdF (DUF218 family)
VFRFAILAGLFVAVIAASSRLWLPWIGQWLVMSPNAHRADAIAVFGGDYNRTEEAARLYRQGMAPQVWHTGWGNTNLPSEGVIAEANQDLVQTIPAQALHLVNTDSTWQDAQAIANLARDHQVDSILVVTHDFHSRRALCSLHHHLDTTNNITIYYTPANSSPDKLDTWWQQKGSRRQIYNEYLKLGYYMLHYGVTPLGC